MTSTRVMSGPEYECLAALGSLCGIDNFSRRRCQRNELCNRYGLDVIGTGAIIAFAMECFEESILTEMDNDGRKVLFGDAAGMLDLVDKINTRQGLGDILARGIETRSQKNWKWCRAVCFYHQRTEIPMHDPRGKTGVGLSYALSPTGANHIETPHDGTFAGDGVNFVKPLGILDPVDPLAFDEAKVRFSSRDSYRIRIKDKG